MIGIYSVRITDTNGCTGEAANTINLELVKKPVADFGMQTNCVLPIHNLQEAAVSPDTFHPILVVPFAIHTPSHPID